MPLAQCITSILNFPTPSVQRGVGKRKLFCITWCRTRLCGRCRCRRNTRCCCRRRSRCCCRCRSCCRCWGRCRLTHWSSKASFIFFLTDLLHFRILKCDSAAGASVLHFNRATPDVINFLRIIHLVRLWIRHLVICGTSTNKETDAQNYDKPSIPYRPFHSFFSFYYIYRHTPTALS